MTEVISARSMGDFVGGQSPKWDHVDTCPVCGGVKQVAAQTCISCSPRKKVGRSRSARDRHRRFEAAVQAGWDEQVLIASRPVIPTWAEIAEVDPEAVIKWHPELIIERWFNEPGG